MDFKLFGKEGAPTLLLIPGLGVSYEIFLPLIDIMKDKFRIIAVQVDGFTLGVHTKFTSVDDQALRELQVRLENSILGLRHRPGRGGAVLAVGKAHPPECRYTGIFRLL